MWEINWRPSTFHLKKEFDQFAEILYEKSFQILRNLEENL